MSKRELHAGITSARHKKFTVRMMQQTTRTDRIGRVGLFPLGGVAASSRYAQLMLYLSLFLSTYRIQYKYTFCHIK